jgi:hypothetical protein
MIGRDFGKGRVIILELGITQGCSNGNYCPSANFNREQMAVFVARDFLGID